MLINNKRLDWQNIQEGLEKVRWRFLRLFGGVILLSIIAYPFNGQVMNLLIRPLKGPLAVFAITEAFWVRLKVSLFSALTLAMPFIFLELWGIVGIFLNPNPFYATYKRYFIGLIVIATILFVLGCSLCFLVVLPAGIQFLISYGGEYVKPMISVDKYFSFCIIMILAFGLSFQLPLVLVILGRSGVVSYKLLARNRRYAILIMAIAAAILTPTPDAYNMALLAGPLIALYEISVWLVWIFGREK
jgi:sec-independent protein translocase protein TatC